MADFDLYGVHARRADLLARTAHPRLRDWWQGYLADCRQQREVELDAAFDRLEQVALAAALTADERLGRHAARLLAQLVAADEPWMTAAHRHHYPELQADLWVAERSKRLVAGLSWAGPWLDDAERAAGHDLLRRRGGQPIADDAARGAWWATAYNSNWCAVLLSGLGLAALALDEPAWLARAEEAVGRVLDLLAPEGAGIEGLGYWTYCTRSSLDLADALRWAGRPALLEHPYWASSLTYPLYGALPDLSGWANFGDCAASGLGGGSLFAALAALTGDGRGVWLADHCGGVGPLDLLRGDPEQAAVPPDDLPSSRVFMSIHLAALRSSWSPDATAFYLKGGSNAWSHCHLDLASFILASRGERLAVDPGPSPYNDHTWTSVEPCVSTAWHNTLTVDGGDQRQPPRYRLDCDLQRSGDAWCSVEEVETTPAWTVLRADATSAYADTLERCVRHVAWFPPDLFVVVDDLRTNAARTQRHLQWLLHSRLPLVTTDTGARIDGERATLHVTVAQPAGWAAKLLPDRPSAGGPVHAWALRPAWHHLWNTSPSRAPRPQWEEGVPELFGRDYRFAVVLEASDAGAPAQPVTVVDGCVRVAGWQVGLSEGRLVVERG